MVLLFCILYHRFDGVKGGIMEFHKKLQLLRQSAGYTQKQMAERLAIAPNAYQQYEYGKREPNIEKLLMLSAILNTSLDSLLCREDWIKSHEGFFDE